MPADAALEPPHALGPPLCGARLRTEPEDFLVEEQLGFAPSGAGQHVLLKVRKRNANTQWVARELARLCGCRPHDVGYAGLKDRRAIAVQWFSVPQSRLTPAQWLGARGADYEILEAHAHARKLPRGALAGNRFTIRARGVSASDAQLGERLAVIGARGVPNYFGPQRFGRGGGNLQRAAAGLRDLKPPERGFVLSAARSLVFNAVLAARVEEGAWERLMAGDLAMLEGRGGHFPVDEPDPTLLERCARLEIHPSGPLWGRGAPPSRGRVLELEERIAAEHPAACALVTEAGMEQERRSLRLAVRELSWRREAPQEVVLRFELARGAYATVVLGEVFELGDYEDSST